MLVNMMICIKPTMLVVYKLEYEYMESCVHLNGYDL